MRTGVPKIVQILIAPNDSTWQGAFLGLGDDGVTYNCPKGRWEPYVPPLSQTPEPDLTKAYAHIADMIEALEEEGWRNLQIKTEKEGELILCGIDPRGSLARMDLN